MERYLTFMNWKTQYVSSFQNGLQVQCNPNQNTSGIFVRIDKLTLKCMWKRKILE